MTLFLLIKIERIFSLYFGFFSEPAKDGTITINISKGNKEGLVPSVIGMQEEDVEKAV